MGVYPDVWPVFPYLLPATAARTLGAELVSAAAFLLKFHHLAT